VVNLVARRRQARVVNLVARRQVLMMMVGVLRQMMLPRLMTPRLMTPGGLTDGLRVVMLDGLMNHLPPARVVNLAVGLESPERVLAVREMVDGPVEEMKAGLPQTTPGQVPQTMNHLPPARVVNLAVGQESLEKVLVALEMKEPGKVLNGKPMPNQMMPGLVEEMRAGKQMMNHRPQARAASQAQAASLARVPSLAQMIKAPMMVGRVQEILSARPSPNSSSVSTQIAPSTKEYWHP